MVPTATTDASAIRYTRDYLAVAITGVTLPADLPRSVKERNE
jgi:hypothetical protein